MVPFLRRTLANLTICRICSSSATEPVWAGSKSFPVLPWFWSSPWIESTVLGEHSFYHVSCRMISWWIFRGLGQSVLPFDRKVPSPWKMRWNVVKRSEPRNVVEYFEYQRWFENSKLVCLHCEPSQRRVSSAAHTYNTPNFGARSSRGMDNLAEYHRIIAFEVGCQLSQSHMIYLSPLKHSQDWELHWDDRIRCIEATGTQDQALDRTKARNQRRPEGLRCPPLCVDFDSRRTVGLRSTHRATVTDYRCCRQCGWDRWCCLH